MDPFGETAGHGRGNYTETGFDRCREASLVGFDPARILSRIQLCFADADLDDATIAALKVRTEPVKLLFADGAQRVIELPVSVSDFTAALNESLQGRTAE